jgi:hypothetical protein
MSTEKKVERELLKVGEKVSIKKTVLEGVILDLAIHNGEVMYLISYTDDEVQHTRHFARNQLVLIEEEKE